MGFELDDILHGRGFRGRERLASCCSASMYGISIEVDGDSFHPLVWGSR